MPILGTRGVTILEPTTGVRYADVTVTLNKLHTTGISFYYYLQPGTASGTGGDYADAAQRVTIAPGTLSATVRIPVYADTAVEGNETFQFVMYGAPGVALAGDAAALVADITIFDTDDAVPDPAPGNGQMAARLMGPPSASASLPTLGLGNATVIEGNSGTSFARFLVTLDRASAAPVTFSYQTAAGTATSASGDFGAESVRTFTIAAGQRAAYIDIPVYGDGAVESDERFTLVLTNIQNAVFAARANSLVGTGTILNDDSGSTSGPTAGADYLRGTAAADTINALGGNDSVFGLGGNDTLTGGSGDDTIWGGDGRDTVYLGLGNDTFHDTRQTDTQGMDRVYGDDGDDRINGDGANDLLDGGNGNDTISGGHAFDTLYGGNGHDLVLGGNGRDRADLGAGNDRYGDTSQTGVLAMDTIRGGAGNDTIHAGGGDDILEGDSGNDLLTGGAGADRFIFRAGAGIDRITDFANNVDTIVFDDTLWGGAPRTVAQVISNYGSLSGGNAVFDFGGGNVLTILGVTSLGLLADDLQIV